MLLPMRIEQESASKNLRSGLIATISLKTLVGVLGLEPRTR